VIEAWLDLPAIGVFAVLTAAYGTVAVASATDMRAIRTAWNVYVKAVIADDWTAMENGGAAVSVDRAYEELLREVSDPKIAIEAGAAVHNALIGATVRAGTARSDRLALAADRTSVIKWAIVLLLGVMTQIAVAVVHLQKPNAQVAALAVFTVAMVTALGLIAMQERPFSGDVRIGNAPLQELLKQHPANGA
jgi:hypothetical protein